MSILNTYFRKCLRTPVGVEPGFRALGFRAPSCGSLSKKHRLVSLVCILFRGLALSE